MNQIEFINKDIIIHCIGDSHVSLFSGYNKIQPEYPDQNYLTKFPFLKTYRLGAVLAYSLDKYNTQNRGREKLFEILSKLTKGDYVLLCFGEIDCRFHLLKQSDISEIPIEFVVEKCIESYFSVIQEIKKMGFTVIVWNAVPTTYIGNNPEFPTYKTHLRRNKCTALFNSKLNIRCKKENIIFIDIYKKLTIFNFTKGFYFFDGGHLNQFVIPFFIKELKKNSLIKNNFKENTSGNYIKKQKYIMRFYFGVIKKYLKIFLKKIYILKRISALSFKIRDFFVVLSYEKKRKILLHYADKYSLNIFVETGTFFGDTVDALKSNFKKTISIELSNDLAIKAQKRFLNDTNVIIYNGDSGKLLPGILDSIDEPCLFWLDGHYSSEFWMGTEFIKTAKGDKNTPIFEELEAIFSHNIKNHIILIDDARCFNGLSDYPSIVQLKEKTLLLNSGYKLIVKSDIIRLIPE